MVPNVNTLCSQEAIKITMPVLLGYLLRTYESYHPDDHHGMELAYFYSLGMSLCILVLAVNHHSLFFNCQAVGMKIRVAMCHMIYKKVSLLDGCWGVLFTCCR